MPRTVRARSSVSRESVDAGPGRSASSLLPATIAVLLLSGASLAVFSPIPGNDWVNFDDPYNFRENLKYRGLDWPHLKWMWTAVEMGHYQPVSWMVHGLNYTLWGMDPRGYHLTSLLLHAANAALATLFFAQILRAAIGARGWILWSGSAFAAGLFALHPLRVESVAWVTTQRDLVSSFFLFLSGMAYIRTVQEKKRGRRAWPWKIAWNAAFALSLLAKPTALGFPLILLVLDLYPLRRLPLDRPKTWLGAPGRRLALEKGAAFAMSLTACSLAPIAEAHSGALVSLEAVNIGDRITLSLYGPSFYLAKTLAPASLIPLYERPRQIALLSGRFLPYVAATLALTGMAILLWRRRPAITAAWLVFLILLAPVSGIVPLGPFMAADRYTYLACLGLAALAGAALIGGLPFRRGFAARSILIAAGIALLAGLGVASRRQCRRWRDSGTLWRYVVEVAPDTVGAHLNLGTHYAQLARYEEAVAEFRRSLELAPDALEPLMNLAPALSQLGKLEDAEVIYRKLVSATPHNPAVWNNLGSLLYMQKKTDDAIAAFDRALEIDPNHADAHSNRGLALQRKGDSTGALAEFQAAARNRPTELKFHNQVVMGLRDLDRNAEADALEQKLKQALAKARKPQPDPS